MTTRYAPALLLAGALGCAPASGTAEWQLETLDGNVLSLRDFAGSWVVLNYWATWCRPCREEMPELDDMDRERTDLVVLGIAWQDATPGELREFLQRLPVGYPIARVDPFDPPAALEAPRVLPTSVVFGPDGREVERLYGPVNRQLIEEVIAGGE